ncbi:MAG: hypothetical protein ACSHX0_05915 [Akkermansiaceae bacterium]
MLARKIFITLRLTLLVSIGIILGGLVGTVYYFNQTGLNQEWRKRIALELENIGIIADFDSLRIDATKGLVAEGLRIFSDTERTNVIANLEHLIIDVDKTKLMRGKIQVMNVLLKQADIALPLDRNNPDSQRVTMNKISGEIYLPNKNTINAKNITGELAGIRLDIDANLWGAKNEESTHHNQTTEEERLARTKLISSILREIEKWHWNPKHPPLLKIYMEGNLKKTESAHVNFSLTAQQIERNGVNIRHLQIKGDYHNQKITLDEISFQDNHGKLNAQANYHPERGTGKFKATSTVHLQMLVKELFDIDFMQQLLFSTPPAVECSGSITLGDSLHPKIALTGEAAVENFLFLGSQFTSLETKFSLQGENLFLSGLRAKQEHGEISGRMLLGDETIRYEAVSTLPPVSYIPFIKNSQLENTLNKLTLSPKSKIHITTKGTMNRHDLTEWASTGHAAFENISYINIPLNSLSGDYSLNNLSAGYTNVKADFDYSDYSLRKAYGGPDSAKIAVDSVTIDREKKLIEIKAIKGTAWPAPVVRLFASKVANHIEKYRFHTPPVIQASGVFDYNKNAQNTNFTIDVQNSKPMDYRFLGEFLKLNRLKAKVNISNSRVAVTDLSFDTLQGDCAGNIVVKTANKQNIPYSGDIQWRQVHLKDLGSVYGFKNAEQGLLTGRIDFSGANDDVRAFNATGSLSLEKGNLFSVPLLGPITPLIGVVLGDRNPYDETAEDASCSYVIKNGIIYSNDFLATTRSLNFTGEGNIDLANKNINMLVRMNARGLFSIILLPLKPFMGMFQFQGTGTFSAPEWHTTMFTNPKRGKNDPIFRVPPKAVVIE